MCSTLFLYISLPLFCTTRTWNFQKRFYGGNVVSVLVHVFFTAAHFLVALLAVSIVTAATKCSCWCCSSNKNMSPLFLSLALDLCRPFSGWVSLAYRFFSVFLLLYIPNFLDMTINLSLILLENADIETIFAFFPFPVSSLLSLKLPFLYKTRVAMRFPAKITSSCIWGAIPVVWVI